MIRLIKRIARTFSLLSFTFFTSMALAGPFSISGPDGMLADLNPVGVPHTISLITSQTGIITDLNVSVELVPGPFAADGGTDLPWDDLDMYLSHNGTTVQLHDSQTNAGPNPGVVFDVTFDDEAGSTLVDLIFSNPFPPLPDALGDYAPNGGGALSDFDGMSLSGLWELTFVENCCSGETLLGSWAISGTTASVPAPASLLILGLGLIGFRGRGSSRGARSLV